MSYRHYLYVVKKSNLKGIRELTNEINAYNKDDWNGPSTLDIDKYCDAKRLLELGSYSDEGFALCKEPHSLDPYTQDIADFHKICNDSEHDFNILNREDMVWLCESYRDRTISYWNKLLGREPLPPYSDEAKMTIEERCKKYVESHLTWQKYICNTNENSKWHLQDTWTYEYEMFNLLHILKMVDWDKECLMIMGY